MPNPIDLQKTLSGVSYPCSKDHGAGKEIIDALDKLPSGDISGPDQVQKAVF